MEDKRDTGPALPHPLVAAIPLVTLIAFIVVILVCMPDDALGGASQMALLIASCVCVGIAMLRYRVQWSAFERSFQKTVGEASTSILILLMIGVMSSTWMISGVVPTLIYYGVQLMTPMLFLPCACIIAAIISVMTGTSWTTVATIGIALMGVGNAIGVPPAMSAGAIISGAYFGDKMSPMSDTTVLASSMAKVDLFAHIRYMVRTTVPSITISLLLYLFIGLQFNGEALEIERYQTGLGNTFHISLWTMLVPLFTALLIYKKVPSLITLILSSAAACVCALVLQPEVVAAIGGNGEVSFRQLFQGIMKVCFTSTQVSTGYGEIDALVATRGMAGMLSTVWLILCAMCFGACMVTSRMIESLTGFLLRRFRSRTGLVVSTVTSGVTLNMIMGDQFLSIIINSSIFREEYERRGYRRELLSRSTEDSSTVTSVLVPWTACGMTQSTVLGIPTLVYLPFCFFNLISPVMSCIVSKVEERRGESQNNRIIHIKSHY